MKLIISEQTAIALCTQADMVLFHITQESHSSYHKLRNEANSSVTFANHSLTLVNGEFVMEINDELFFKYTSVYLKIARVVGPFIEPIKNLARSLAADMKDIERFISQRK